MPVIHYQPDRSNLRPLYEYVDRAFGGGITPYDKVLEMQGKNPAFMNGFMDEGIVVGYYSLVPLHKRSGLSMVANQCFGAELTADDMVLPSEEPYAVYIGAIIANPGYSKDVKATMFEAIRGMKPHPGTPVLTRPISDQGHSMFERLNFVPLRSPSRDGERINHICLGTPEF